MSEPGAVVRGPAPAFDGPLVCTLLVDQFAGRLDAFRREVSGHLRSIERPLPSRLRLVLGAGADRGRVRALLVREQACCGFLAFTITPGQREYPEDAVGLLRAIKAQRLGFTWPPTATP